MSIRRKINRIICFFGKHDYRMGSTSKTGKAFGCLFCGKDWK
jgi:hypothetical protein